MHMRIFLGSLSTAINKFQKGLMTQKLQELLIQNIVIREMAFQIQKNKLRTFGNQKLSATNTSYNDK